MTLLLVCVHVMVCLILILVILLQAGRGQGLTGPSFGSGNVQSLFGTRAADFLTKATSVSAICFLFTCIGLDYLETQRSRSLLEGARPQAPVDMATIQKALEKIKAESKETKTTPKSADTASLAAPSETPMASPAAVAESEGKPQASDVSGGQSGASSN